MIFNNKGKAMKNYVSTFTLTCMAYMCFVAYGGNVLADETNRLPTSAEQCLKTIADTKQAKECFENIHVKLEAKRLALEKRAPLEMPDVRALKDGLDWNAEYDAAAADARIFFEQYRLAECARRQLLQLETALTGYERELCMIELTSERISTLTPKSMK